jgi:hypothetical protein
MEFYGHQWKWDEVLLVDITIFCCFFRCFIYSVCAQTNGLSLLFQKDESASAEYTPWKDIIATVPIQVTPQGWLLFDGWTYTHKGEIARYEPRK